MALPGDRRPRGATAAALPPGHEGRLAAPSRSATASCAACVARSEASTFSARSIGVAGAIDSPAWCSWSAAWARLASTSSLATRVLFAPTPARLTVRSDPPPMMTPIAAFACRSAVAAPILGPTATAFRSPGAHARMDAGADRRCCQGLRRGRRRAMRSTIPAIMTPVLAIATIVACGLAVYLVVAMLAPERFS